MKIKKSTINIINNPNKSFVQSIFIEGNKNQSEKAGSLFILAEVNHPDKISKKIIFIISQLLEKNYYLNEKIFLADNINGLKAESIFESSLIKTNKELLEFIDQEKINFNFKNLNVIAGLFYEEQIFFSSMGQNKSFLIRKTDKGLHVSDINPDGEDFEMDELASGKIFSSIVSGDMPDNSFIIFTNESLSQYLLNDEFLKILENLKLEGASEQIKNSLKRINNYSNFSGLLIKKVCNTSEFNDLNCEKNNLIASEKNTEDLLKAPGSISKKQFRKKIFYILNKINIFKVFSLIIKALKKASANKKSKIKNNNEIINEIIDNNSPKKNKIKKVLIIGLLILLSIFVTSLYFQKNKENKIIEEDNSYDFEELINQKLSQVESSLLYNNEIRAREIIEEIRQNIDSLSSKEKNKIKNFNEIEEKLGEQINKIQKMIKISNPREIANFSMLNSDNQINSIAFNSSDKNIYALDGKNNSIYSLDLNDGLLSKITENENIKGDASFSANYKNNSYFIISDQFISIEKNKSVNLNKISVEDISSISSFDVYDNKAYLADKNKNQVFRYTKNANIFSSASPRINNTESLDIIGMAIDHNTFPSPIFILNKNGSINKYFNGNKEDYQIDIIDPVIESPDIIRLDKDYIYVLEKNKNRIVVFSKNNGSFVNQYYSENLSNIKDINIDEAQRKIYILNDSKIFEINLSL